MIGTPLDVLEGLQGLVLDHLPCLAGIVAAYVCGALAMWTRK